jgi:hypothetical protein
MPPLIVRILLFVILAVALVALAWMGSSQRRTTNEEQINAQRRSRETDTATRAFDAAKPVSYPGTPTTLPATNPSPAAQPSH